MSTVTNYDAVVIGGGPGGSTVGALLAQGKFQVLLLERERFPRFHIGESLLPFGNDVLKETGVWQKIQDTGFQVKLGAEFCLSNGSRFHRFWFANGLVPGYGQAFQVERARFDDVLLRHAAETGCVVRQGCPAQSVARDGDEWLVTYADGATSCQARTRWLIDASGRDAFLGRALNLARGRLEVPKRVAIYAHFTNVYRNPGDAEGHITIVRLEDGWFWIIPMADGKTSVGMVRSLGDLKSFGNNPEAWFEQTVSQSSELNRRMQRAQRLTRFHTTSDYSYRHRQMAMERGVLVGDAAGFIDPIFSSGVSVALKSGALAARLILQADSEHRGLTIGEQRRYTGQVQRLLRIYLAMIQMYYDNRSFEVFMFPHGPFKMVQAVNSVLAGNTRPSLTLWWRMMLFRLVCAIHRRVSIVPPLDYREKKVPAPVQP